jgi:hypothetical protein
VCELSQRCLLAGMRSHCVFGLLRWNGCLYVSNVKRAPGGAAKVSCRTGGLPVSERGQRASKRGVRSGAEINAFP